MKVHDITDAIGGADKPTLRRAFRSLVSLPREEEIEASSPGLLIVALDRVCVALADDSAFMPPVTCESLGLEAGESYGQGAAATKAQWSRVSRAIVDAADRQTNSPGGVIGVVTTHRPITS
ncbi:hypothetical protein [Bosea sp. CRIB-10]|uniref:hypothetical protein n=1 Tax=Bosea sp. CRIB-10 TaxID=378404 RepID=UPI000B895F62|nr:hypothetical protein [Bosea sp. CRIB-10]